MVLLTSIPCLVQAEPEEEEVVELTEEEEAIKATLESTDSLSPEILDNIVPQWWNKEPFKLVFLLDVWVLLAFPGLSVDANSLFCQSRVH